MSRKKRKAVNVRKKSDKAKFTTCLYKHCSVLFREAVKKNGPKRPRGIQFCNMVIGHALGSVQVLHQQKYP